MWLSSDQLNRVIEILNLKSSYETQLKCDELRLRSAFLNLKFKDEQRAQTQLSLLCKDLPVRSTEKYSSPTYIYSFKEASNRLYRTVMKTGQVTTYKINSFTFLDGCSWTELPSGDIFISVES